MGRMVEIQLSRGQVPRFSLPVSGVGRAMEIQELRVAEAVQRPSDLRRAASHLQGEAEAQLLIRIPPPLLLVGEEMGGVQLLAVVQAAVSTRRQE
jgi:hypothetical protein